MTNPHDTISRKAALEKLGEYLAAWADKAINGSSLAIVSGAIRALPSVGVTVTPGQIERLLWDAMVWAASTPTPRPGVNIPAYTAQGNSDAEVTCRAAAARIIAALDVQPHEPATSNLTIQNCEINLRGAGYDCIHRNGDFVMGRYGEGDAALEENGRVFLKNLAVLGPVALAEKIQKALDVQPAPAPSPDTCADAQSRTDQETALSPDVEAQTFYIDCEFDGHNGPLLSIAMVAADGLSLHIHTDEVPVDPWVIQNVMPALHQHKADQAFFVGQNEVGEMLRAFIGDCQNPTIIADSPVDIGRFCRAISTGSDGGWASTGYQSMAFKVENVDCYPTDLVGAVQHNAWWDAMALRAALAAMKGGE